MIRTIKTYLMKNTKFGKSRYLNFLYKYDLNQFMEYSCLNENNHESIATKIRILTHAIEKGMSLPECRAGFGRDKILELIQLNEQYKNIGDAKDDEIDTLVHSIVCSYIEYQDQKGIKIDFIPDEYRSGERTLTGIMSVPVNIGTDFENIANHRHSSRSYADKEVRDELISEIVRLAQTAPSACNRQATRVYAVVDNEKKKAIMKMHGGVRGFDLPGVIFVITGELSLYQNEFERNAVYIDGGIFLMNLLYAIDSKGLASCPVIWGSEPTNDRILCELVEIPKSEKIISLAMAGHYPTDEYVAAVSSKRQLKSLLKIV